MSGAEQLKASGAHRDHPISCMQVWSVLCRQINLLNIRGTMHVRCHVWKMIRKLNTPDNASTIPRIMRIKTWLPRRLPYTRNIYLIINTLFITNIHHIESTEAWLPRRLPCTRDVSALRHPTDSKKRRK